MGKVFQEQTKTIKDQGEEQGKAIKGNNTKSHSYENELLLLKEWEMFKNTYNKRFDRIEESTKKMIMVILNFLLKVMITKRILLK